MEFNAEEFYDAKEAKDLIAEVEMFEEKNKRKG